MLLPRLVVFVVIILDVRLRICVGKSCKLDSCCNLSKHMIYFWNASSPWPKIHSCLLHRRGRILSRHPTWPTRSGSALWGRTRTQSCLECAGTLFKKDFIWNLVLLPSYPLWCKNISLLIPNAVKDDKQFFLVFQISSSLWASRNPASRSFARSFGGGGNSTTPILFMLGIVMFVPCISILLHQNCCCKL